MKGALESSVDPDATVVMSADERQAQRLQLPVPGETFGGYEIERELGRGGMGAVYEAAQTETGRRVALKVLSHKLDNADARARFLREGRLAASINHPNSVYVFGTEEIEGTPAISMELIAGSTLEEKVRRDGPLPAREAVDVVLQLISGLEEAQKTGILHRDIKPANCFEDRDGSVKIGDFGLSISTEGRDDTNLTLDGTFLGTPAFSSPEQLRGEELSVRSDIYSVGVTLYFLLTGKTPFEGKSAAQIFANVLEKKAPSPREHRPDLPSKLAGIVMRCIEKTPSDRFKNYAELRSALAPFGLEAVVPSIPPMRMLATAIDMCFLTLFWISTSIILTGGVVTTNDPDAYKSLTSLGMLLLAFSANIGYFGFFEGRHGAALGKWICRIRVAGSDRNPPGILRATVRAVILLGLMNLPYWVVFGISFVESAFYESPALMYSLSFSMYGILALIFIGARRRNGWSGLHDFVTKTQVIRKQAFQERPRLAAAETDEVSSIGDTSSLRKLGPYHILTEIEKNNEATWLLAYDTRLLRKTWVKSLEPGASPIDPRQKKLSRVGRLRWITGRRSENENWDIFEAPSGDALVNLLDRAHPWSHVRYWLLDLAEEMAAAQEEGTLPAKLSLDQVWITADGRAKLLDFRAPGAESAAAGPATQPGEFLHQIAEAALGNSTRPIHAQKVLAQLPESRFSEPIVAAIKPLIRKLATVTPMRRAAVVLGCAAYPLFSTVLAVTMMHQVGSSLESHPEVAKLGGVLNHRNAQSFVPEYRRIDDRVFEIHIASRYKEVVEDPETWSATYSKMMIAPPLRAFAENSVKNHPNPDPDEAAEALKLLESVEKEAGFVFTLYRKPWFPVLAFGATLFFTAAVPAVLAAIAFRGGLVMLIAGVGVARAKDGVQASRFRVYLRSVIAWAPLPLAVIVGLIGQPLKGEPVLDQVSTTLLCVLIMVGIPIVSLLIPGRGIHDRIAGTVLIPR